MNATQVRGHLDGLQGACVVGWALSQQHEHCEIAVTDPSQHVIARGLAALERPDLSGISGNRANFAFRIPLPDLNGTALLHVLADGVELANSPIRVGPGRFDGQFAQHHGRIEGWVAERIPRFSQSDITIEDQDGDILLRCQSQRGEADKDGFAPARFAGDLEQRCFGRGELRLTGRANGIKFASLSSPPLHLNGVVETLTPERCSGWLLSPSAPQKAFDIDIFRDGVLVRTARCDIQRSDVHAIFPGCVTPGFDASLPPAARHLAFSSISFRLPGSDRDLFEGPYLIGRCPELVLAARQAASAMLRPVAGAVGPAEQAVVQSALADFLARARRTDRMIFAKQPHSTPEPVADRQLNIIVPVYRGLALTRACIDSVLATRSPERHRLVIVNDKSPDPDMAGMLRAHLHHPNVFLLTNEANLGFVKSVNRALSFCGSGDVLLLNADTRLFPGGIRELWEVAHASPDIGTVTALSNNATIFSYPHASLRGDTLDDIGWDSLAAVALEKNRGIIVDVPTGHGFCLLIKREVLRRVGHLDESFGRGYGEENDLCARAADLGYRNVAAAGALVEHRESTSFAGEKKALLDVNLPKLEARYPEYTPIIMDVERRDIFRAARWPLDAARLARARAAGSGFVLLIHHALGGGTAQAMADIEEAVGYGESLVLTLCCRADGFMQLTAKEPVLHAQFAPDECAPLMDLLAEADIGLVVAHQLLGFPPDFLAQLEAWLPGRRSIFYAHDYYAVCPRVTLIDGVDRFCGVAPADVCERCLEMAGPHDASRLTHLKPAEHRRLFSGLLQAFTHVVTPSGSAAANLRRVFDDLTVTVLPHPSLPIAFPPQARAGADDEIVLFGAIGAHKGSAKLLEIAQLARLVHPALTFRVIGYTDRDEALRRAGNVIITGAYKPGELPALALAARGRHALFLSGWPETFSYTLSEAVELGFIPLVPDIGAMAERVRAAGFGAVFNFPIDAADVLAMITRLGQGHAYDGGLGPEGFAPSSDSVARTRALMGQ
jgi:GT2 family glycosyltransferase/glycosyltransferase involved in cell wall biosynthesis